MSAGSWSAVEVEEPRPSSVRPTRADRKRAMPSRSAARTPVASEKLGRRAAELPSRVFTAAASRCERLGGVDELRRRGRRTASVSDAGLVDGRAEVRARPSSTSAESVIELADHLGLEALGQVVEGLEALVGLDRDVRPVERDDRRRPPPAAGRRRPSPRSTPGTARRCARRSA